MHRLHVRALRGAHSLQTRPHSKQSRVTAAWPGDSLSFCGTQQWSIDAHGTKLMVGDWSALARRMAVLWEAGDRIEQSKAGLFSSLASVVLPQLVVCHPHMPPPPAPAIHSLTRQFSTQRPLNTLIRSPSSSPSPVQSSSRLGRYIIPA